MEWITGKSESHCNVTCPEINYNCPHPEIPEFKCPEYVCPEYHVPKLTCGDTNQDGIICPELNCPIMKCPGIVCPQIKFPKFNCSSTVPKENLTLYCPETNDNSTALIILVAFLVLLAILILILQFFRIRRLMRQIEQADQQSFPVTEMPSALGYSDQVDLGRNTKSTRFVYINGETNKLYPDYK